MFVRTGPFYQAQHKVKQERTNTLVQFHPIKADDVIQDNQGSYVVLDLVRHEGKTLVLVRCIGSLDIDLIGRVGYKSMHDALSKCWRPSLF